MTIFLTLLAVFALLWMIRRFTGFSAQRPADYADTTPAFDIRSHMSGPLACEGVIYGPMGRVSARFIAKMQGEFGNGDAGTLAEHFTYATGAKQDRKWNLNFGSNGHFTATADDVIGVASGEMMGSAVRMTYRIRLEPDAGGHVLSVTDWLYLMDNGVIMNRSEMRKFGVKVAELVATIRPEGAARVQG